MKKISGFVAIMFVAGSLACGGGGEAGRAVNGGGGGSNNVVASFTPDEPNPGSDSVAVDEQSGGTNSMVTIRINVTGVTDLFGAGFDLFFDPNHVQFVNWSPGTALEQGGSTSYQVSASQPGKVVVGAACTGCANGVNIAGTTPLIDLVFQVTDAGTSSLVFSSEELFDSQGANPTPIVGLTWFGGTFVGN